MNVTFKKSFTKDLKIQSKNKKLLSQIKNIIKEIEDAKTSMSLKTLKNLRLKVPITG
jgi:hypothetical protein